MGPIVLRISLISAILFTAWAQNRPPAITVGPDREAYISYSKQFMSRMNCKTSGTPTPSVTWYINSQPVNLNSQTSQNSVSSDGTLNMTSPEEGYYQCSAINNYGTAWSNVSWVRRLQLNSPPTAAIRDVTVYSGQSLTLPCLTDSSIAIIPAAIYKWQTVPDTLSSDIRDINFDTRIQMQDNGSLTFSYVLPADNQDNRLYRCQLTNALSNDLQLSVAYSRVNVMPGQPPPNQLTKLFNYSWPTLALERNNVSLRCFFAGAQSITVSWKKSDGANINQIPGRYVIETSRLLIMNVQKADEDVYTCTGSSSSSPLSSASATVNLRVESAPYFVSVNDGPLDINVTNGDDVVINCSAYAIPDAYVQWYRNGQPFDSSSLPRKFKLSADKKTLTISNVCKYCPEASSANSDLMVIQCNASNAHGYMYSNGYINVLDRTEIKKGPVDVVLDYPNPVIFTCEATSDVATVVNYSWTRNHQPVYDGSVNQSTPGVGLLYIDVAKDKKKGVDFTGVWTCTATNGVSSDQKSASLVGHGGVAGASVWPFWWIPFIAILIFLIVVALFLLICWWCCYMNRGDAYPVDEEERKGGNDPVKELHEIGFHDFQRPVDAPDGVILNTPLERARRGPGSISSSIGKGVSDDEMSLDNYSNINHGKFTEDGSFIGQYNPNRRKIQVMQPGIPESMA